MMFCFLPTNNIALGSMSKDKVGNASGLYNLTRNLGGAVGLAVISTLLTDKTKIFSQYLNENISSTSPSVLMKLQFIGQLLDGRVIDPEKVSYFLLASNINKEAFVIAINSIFGIISALFFMVMVFLPFTSTVRGGEGYDAH